MVHCWIAENLIPDFLISACNVELAIFECKSDFEKGLIFVM
jgi:hypothetical protein